VLVKKESLTIETTHPRFIVAHAADGSRLTHNLTFTLSTELLSLPEHLMTCSETGSAPQFNLERKYVTCFNTTATDEVGLMLRGAKHDHLVRSKGSKVIDREP